MFNPFHQPLDTILTTDIQQQLPRAFQRCISYATDTIGSEGSQKAHRHGGPDVDGLGKPSGQFNSTNLAGIDTQHPHQDELSAKTGRLGLCQVAGILTLKQAGNAGKIAYFMSAEKVKWRKPVKPGDVLQIDIELLKARSKVAKARGVCTVGGDVVSEADITFSLMGKE